MKLSDLLKGGKAEREVSLPLACAGGAEVRFALRPLSSDEDATAMAAARAFAEKRGVRDPQDGNTLYDAAYWANVVALSAVDLDSLKDARQPFFDQGAEQVMKHLHPEEIAHVYERQAAWQEECSPSLKTKTFAELVSLTRKLAEASDDGPFVRLSPYTRWICARFMAKQLLDSPTFKSLISSPSEASTPSSSNA